MNNIRRAIVVVLCLFSITQIYTQTRNNNYPVPKREMRGIWVATINNIDWPSQPGLSPAQLKHETCVILDRIKALGLNTVFLQVRPSADAIYMSDIEPLSYYLVGDSRQQVNSFDALDYWIAEAHSRGLELHAWINPFRATSKADFPCAPNHVSHTHPQWLVSYANKLYLNPGLPEARDYICRIVSDIAHRYDIDGIHFDDYFYPYPVKDATFDDSFAFEHFNPMNLTLDDWRRQNVDQVIERVGKNVRNEKPWLVFGVSPFGVWRNKADDEEGSNTRAGITNYDILYADVAKWIKNKWIDYVVPQIYWEQGNPAADFDELTNWWSRHANEQSQVFVGHAVFKVNASNKAWENPLEIPSQITKVRLNNRLGGSVFFSYRQFNRDLLGLENQLQTSLYDNRALSPLGCDAPETDIRIRRLRHRGNTLTWKVAGDTASVRFYAVYRHLKGSPLDPNDSEYLYDVVGEPQITLPQPPDGKRQKYVYRISAIDKYRHEHTLSKRIVLY